MSGLNVDASVVAHCRQRIEIGSKSFALASKVFEPESRVASFLLYGWCRYCDDQIDEGSENASLVVSELERTTSLALRGEASFTIPEFEALRAVASYFGIPEKYPLDLIQGMKMDVEMDAGSLHYPDLPSLKRYCYCVAGTVGLMMAHIMGVSRKEALSNACDLGIAMQLTNIARDVGEDARAGRVYLPQDWLKEVGVDGKNPNALLFPENQRAVYSVIIRILNAAEIFYDSATSGISALPWRAAWAVTSAADIYASIGTEIRLGGESSWPERKWVSKPRKIFLVARAFLKILGSAPFRVVHPHRRASL